MERAIGMMVCQDDGLCGCFTTDRRIVHDVFYHGFSLDFLHKHRGSSKAMGVSCLLLAGGVPLPIHSRFNC